jgi:hypothetical protein
MPVAYTEGMSHPTDISQLGSVISHPRIEWKQANTFDLDTFEHNIWTQKPVVNTSKHL